MGDKPKSEQLQKVTTTSNVNLRDIGVTGAQAEAILARLTDAVVTTSADATVRHVESGRLQTEQLNNVLDTVRLQISSFGRPSGNLGEVGDSDVVAPPDDLVGDDPFPVILVAGAALALWMLS